MRFKMKSAFLAFLLTFLLFVPAVAFADEVVILDAPAGADEPAYVEEPVVVSEPQLWCVTDAAGLLTESENVALEERAQAIQSQYGVGVYIVTVYDYTEFSPVSVYDAAVRIYTEYSLGLGEDKDGIMLLLSMYDRDFSLIVYGDFANYAFNDEGRIEMTDYFLDDFSYDYWYAGFADFLEWTSLYLEAAVAGEPYSHANPPMTDDDVMATIGMYLLAILLIPLLITLVVIRSMDAKMKTVATATHASEYVVGSLQLTNYHDLFVHKTQTVVRINTDDHGGGFSTHGGGGFSGTSGKF